MTLDSDILLFLSEEKKKKKGIQAFEGNPSVPCLVTGTVWRWSQGQREGEDSCPGSVFSLWSE